MPPLRRTVKGVRLDVWIGMRNMPRYVRSSGASNSIVPALGEALGERLALGLIDADGDRLTDADGLSDDDGLSDADGLALGDRLTDALTLLDGDIDALGDGERLGDRLADADGLRDTEALGDDDGLIERLTDADGLNDNEAPGDGDGLALDEGLGEALGEADSDAIGGSPPRNSSNPIRSSQSRTAAWTLRSPVRTACGRYIHDGA